MSGYYRPHRTKIYMAKTVSKQFTLKQAIELATSKHKNQQDKAGQPYIHHPLNVMNQLQGNYAKMAGVLHDVVEDSDTTFEDLEKMGCPKIVISALRLVTHPPGHKGTEEEYIKAIQAIANSGNQLAIDVKWADLTHNSDVSRTPNPEDRDLQRLNKYHKSMEILKPFISNYLKMLKK